MTVAELRTVLWQKPVSYALAPMAITIAIAIAMARCCRSHWHAPAAVDQQPVVFMVGTLSREQSLLVNFNLPKTAILAVPKHEADTLYSVLDDKTAVGQR
ncbi:MAG: hypothetical protein ACOH1V_05380 [Stenotrophomonas sp.]